MGCLQLLGRPPTIVAFRSFAGWGSLHSPGVCLSRFYACILSRVLKCGILKLVSGCGWLVWPALLSLLAPWSAAVVLFVVQLLDTILTLDVVRNLCYIQCVCVLCGLLPPLLVGHIVPCPAAVQLPCLLLGPLAMHATAFTLLTAS